MARIDALPSIEIIRGLKGILDFYVWKGLPCVRAWPRWRPTRQSDASKAAALTFGAIVKAYALLANLALLAYREDALDQPRTARDITVTGVYGNLHEASMSDFLDALIIIRDAVVALTDLLHALDSINTDEIVVNVDQSVLPPLAATTTNQATAITALQKIDDLQDALESKALDRLLVRGMDQLFTYSGPLQVRVRVTANDTSEDLNGGGPDPGDLWILTNMNLMDFTNNTTSRALIYKYDDPDDYNVKGAPTTTKQVGLHWTGLAFLEPGDIIRGFMDGVTIGDAIQFDILGHIMTLET